MSASRVAVIGCGRWGANLLRDMIGLRGVAGVIACDASEAVRARAAADYPGLEVRADAATLWGDADVLAVVVATNVPSHGRMALAAIEAGKHVLVEKPLADSVADAEAMRAAAERAGVVLTVDHLLLADPAFQEALRLASDGALGEVRHAYARRTNLGVVRTEENVLWSIAPHDIAVMLRLFGATPLRVTAHGGVTVQPARGIEDYAFVTLEFPGGRLGHLHVSWLDPAKLRQVTIVGTEGMAVVDDAAEARLQVFDRAAHLDAAGQPVLRDGGARAVPLEGESPLTRMCRAFLDCVEGRGPNPSDGALGVEVVSVLAAAQASLDAARAEVAP